MDPAAQEAANPPVLHRATHVAERMLLGGSFDERYCAAEGFGCCVRKLWSLFETEVVT